MKKDFYLETRDHIKHEDQLLHYRMSWLIALQAFLFSAYGFSLSAQSTLSAAYIARKESVPADSDVQALLHHARLSFSLIGMSSSVFVFLGIIAAIISMGDLVDEWKPGEGCPDAYPQIIGNQHRHSFGIYLGLMPVMGLPLSCLLVWFVIGYSEPYFSAAVAAIAVIGAVAYGGLFVGQKLAKKA